MSHYIKLAFLDGPYSNMNSTKLGIVIPLLKTPPIVGILGSLHPSTIPYSTILPNLLLDKVVFTKFNLEKS